MTQTTVVVRRLHHGHECHGIGGFDDFFEMFFLHIVEQ